MLFCLVIILLFSMPLILYHPNIFGHEIAYCKRCGLKKLIYVVEGDPNSSEAAESIKTA